MKNVQKMQKYVNARLMAVQALYMREITGESFNQVVSRFLMGELGGKLFVDVDNHEEEVVLPAGDMQLFTHLMSEVQERGDDFQNILTSIMREKVDFSKLDLVLKCILTVGVAEFYVSQELETPIIVNEYVDMTRAFYNASEPAMVNAVLDQFAKTIR